MEELLPYLATRWAPASTPGNGALCDLYALTDSLNPHGVETEGLDPRFINPSFDEILAKVQSSEYEDRIKAIAKEFPRSRKHPGGDEEVEEHVHEEYMQQSWLKHERLAVVLETIDADLGTNYRLGVVIARQPAKDKAAAKPLTAYLYNRPAGGGPVIWLYSYGHDTD